jgi:anti-sigma factor RsiW
MPRDPARACDEMRLLIQAEHDGELDAARAAGLARHVADCPGCAALRRDLGTLSARLRTEITRHEAPAALRAAFAAPPRPRRTPPHWIAPFGSGAGLALAACLAVFLLLPRGPDVTSQIVDDHIRALQPGHLMDVVSTDQHTVKPWFDGRIDFAPPVRDFAAQGYPLVGGRIDYIGGHPAAVLIFSHGKHIIDLTIWPERGAAPLLPANGSRSGYNYRRWTADGLTFWAVSDVEADQLAQFERLWAG